MKRPCSNCGGTGIEPDHLATGSKLKATRKASGITQQFVAKAMGITETYLCDLEHGRRKWTLDKIQKYEKAVT